MRTSMSSTKFASSEWLILEDTLFSVTSSSNYHRSYYEIHCTFSSEVCSPSTRRPRHAQVHTISCRTAADRVLRPACCRATQTCGTRAPSVVAASDRTLDLLHTAQRAWAARGIRTQSRARPLAPCSWFWVSKMSQTKSRLGLVRRSVFDRLDCSFLTDFDVVLLTEVNVATCDNSGSAVFNTMA